MCMPNNDLTLVSKIDLFIINIIIFFLGMNQYGFYYQTSIYKSSRLKTTEPALQYKQQNKATTNLSHPTLATRGK